MGDDTQASFIRQRRNLIAVSLVLIFAQAHKAEFTKISIFGTDLSLGQSLDPTLYLWIAFFYLLWRYFSYFFEIGEKGFFNRHRERLKVLVEKIALKLLVSDPTYSKILNTRLKHMELKGWQLTASHYADNTPSRWRWTLVLIIAGCDISDCKNSKARLTNIDMPIEVSVDGFLFLCATARAWGYVLFRTPLFSEYVVPFLISSIPILYFMYHYAVSLSM